MLSASEPRFRHALDPEPTDAEHTAGTELRPVLLRKMVVNRWMGDPRHRGDINLIKIVAAESQAGDVLDRHADATFDLTIRGIPDKVTTNHQRIPDTAFLVYGATVKKPCL